MIIHFSGQSNYIIRIKNKPTPFLPPNNEDNNNKPKNNSISDSNVSCPICKLEFTQKEIEEHLKDHLKNSLSKDFICDRLKINKSAIEFDNIFYKLTDFQIRELIKTLQKYIEKYGNYNLVHHAPWCTPDHGVYIQSVIVDNHFFFF